MDSESINICQGAIYLKLYRYVKCISIKVEDIMKNKKHPLKHLTYTNTTYARLNISSHLTMFLMKFNIK